MDQVKALGITDFNPYKLSRQEIDSDLPRDIVSRLFDYTTCNFQRTILGIRVMAMLLFQALDGHTLLERFIMNESSSS